MGESEFRNQPRPSDWVLSDEVAARLNLDPNTMAVLSESEQDGIPVPFIFNFVAELAERAGQLAQVSDISSPLADIDARLAEEQARFPDAPVWDHLRQQMVDHLLEHNRGEAAFDFAWTIAKPQLAALRILDVNFASGGEYTGRIAVQLELIEDLTRKVALLKALRDEAILQAPFSDAAPSMNTALERLGAETDHLQGWIDSQRAQYPNWDWDAARASIIAESYWTGVPMPVRQYFMWRNYHIQDDIFGQKVPEEEREQQTWLLDVLEFVDELEDSYPEATIFGHFRGVVSVCLVATRPELAVALANTIRDPQQGAGVVGEFVGAGKEAEAIEVATNLLDPELLVDALTATDWRDTAAPLARLGVIIESDDYPLQKRISVLEVVVGRLGRSGGYTTPYQTLLNQLKGRLGG